MAADLFNRDLQIGTFKGFAESGLEFAAEIVVPYQPVEDLTPRSGQLLLVELGTPEEAILGRITRFVPVGVMAGAEGDEYLASMSRLSREVPEQLKEDRLRYNVRVKLLGGLRTNSSADSPFSFVPSVRKLPHLGARVSYPTADVLDFLCRLGAKDAVRDTTIGHYALGEVIYNGGQEAGEDYFVSMPREVRVHFDAHSLVGKRTFVFARAGYGKSNLMKILIAELYRSRPIVRVGDVDKQVGMLIFDPEGEYFWPDDHGRPGLCDVPHLRERIAVFTNRPVPNPYYGSWKAGHVRLDLRQCVPAEVVSLCLSEERQDQQNVIKMRGLTRDSWSALIELLHGKGYDVIDEEVKKATGITGLNALEYGAMRGNLVPVIGSLHDPESRLLETVDSMLRDGRIVVIDLSLVSGRIGLQIAGLLLNRIFKSNQESFTDSRRGGLLPVIAVIEEAQSVLSHSTKEESPFVRWTKEGRKYSLGAILVTQQPGSIAPEMLSQGDNFFAFHLLSAHDLKTLQFHNAHFSDDVLAHLLNEPIRGNVYFWSAPHQPFVLPARIRNFEGEYGPGMPDQDRLTHPVETGIEAIRSSQQATIRRLSVGTREAICGGRIRLDALDGDDTVCLVFKPYLAAQVGEMMSDAEREKYCRGGPFVGDSILDQIVEATGLATRPIRIRGQRSDNKKGDFYRLASAELPALSANAKTVSSVEAA